MHEYREYFTDSAENLSGPARYIRCADDAEAAKKALGLLVPDNYNATGIEIWQGSRLVARMASCLKQGVSPHR